MARIAGVDIPVRSGSRSASPTSSASEDDRTEDDPRAGAQPRHACARLTDEEVNRIRTYVDANLKVEGDLRRDIHRTSSARWIGCYQVSAIGAAYPCEDSARRQRSAPAKAQEDGCWKKKARK